MRSIRLATNEIMKFLWNRDYEFFMVPMGQDEETTNFPKWKKEYIDLDCNQMKILADFCSDTIFDLGNFKKYGLNKGDHFNLMSRLWHDEYHYNLDLDFSLDSELKVQWGQFKELKGAGVSNEALILFTLDMVGQSEYYGFFKKFLNNQKSMVKKWYEIYSIVYGDEIPRHWNDFTSRIASLVKFVGEE